jgi:transcriptional regulator with XRE-family HTH domain
MDRVWQGAALRQLRMLARKSIADVAAACEIGQSAVSQWELGISNPRREHLEEMAALYEMPLELLLYEIGYELSNPPSLRQWYKRRMGTIPASASGTATVATVGNTPSEDTKRQLPLAKARLARVLLAAATL